MRFLLAAAGVLAALQGAAGQPAPLIDFPTENHSLLQGRPQEFFMYVERDFEGERTKPWQGGQYGFVRGPRRSGNQIIYTSMHEGIDIRPLQRGIEGNPVDKILAAADGRVVHVSREAGASNYGRYVVVEHLWDGCPYYTLYAHLATIEVEPGQQVRQGQPMAVMGFTGAGINRERAHVHFEVCLMLSRNFDGWHEAFFQGNPNRHGLFNGLNLVGTDPARLLLEARENPTLRISNAISRSEPSFKITVNNSPNLSLIRNYPWLVPNGEIANPPAWAITFSRHGVPLKAEAAMERVAEPTVTWVKDSSQAYTHTTKGLVTGSPGHPRLTESGLRFARLLTWPD